MGNRTGPLAGLRVVEFQGIGPGPYCGMLLADLGAELIQIDRPAGANAAYNIAATSDVMNRGRRSVVLDLKDPLQVETALKLIEKADAVVESNRPGVAERLGFGPEACLARNPRLVYGRVTGFGQTGPLANRVGHDINYISIAGALHPVGAAGGPPVIPMNFVADMGGGGLMLAFGMCAALLEAQRSGQGQVVDAAMTDGAASLLAAYMTMIAVGRFDDVRGSHFNDGASHFYNVYETSDGKWISVGAIEPAFYAAFRKGAGLTGPEFDDQYDVAAWPDLRSQVASIIAAHPRDHWIDTFPDEACVTPVLALAEVEHHPHNRARETFFRDEAGLLHQGIAPRFSRTPGRVANPPPARGADTDAVLREWGVS